MDAKVALGMTTFNSERWVERAIDSILGQTYGQYELIISDNQSEDGTLDLLEYYTRNDKRIRLFRQPRNIGPMPNASFVLKQASAPFFKWALSNDYIAPSYLERCMAVLAADEGLIGVQTRAFLIDANGDEDPDPHDQYDLTSTDPVVRFKCYRRTVRLNHLLQGVFRREALRKAGFLRALPGHDIVYVATLALIGRIELIPDRLFHRSVAPGAISTQFSGLREIAGWHRVSRTALLGTNFRLLGSQWAALLLEDLSPVDRLRLLGALTRLSRWSAGDLASDIRVAYNYLHGKR